LANGAESLLGTPANLKGDNRLQSNIPEAKTRGQFR
jgi:hypothetical protein